MFICRFVDTNAMYNTSSRFVAAAEPALAKRLG